MTHEQLKTYESQLKPCPFCGSKARLNNSFGWFTARCTAKIPNCDVFPETMAYRTIEEAIKAWNTRSEEFVMDFSRIESAESFNLKKVLEDIKAEIKERIEMWGTDNDEYHDCLEIIDKHIKGVNK